MTVAELSLLTVAELRLASSVALAGSAVAVYGEENDNSEYLFN